MVDTIETISLHSLPVCRLTMEQALEAIDDFVKAGGPHHVVTLDASMCVMAREDAELKTIIEQAELVTPDSAGVLWACARRGTPLPQRVSGVEIVDRLCALSPERGYRIFFFGSAPGVAEAAAARQQEKYPGCIVAGTRNGYFNSSEEEAIVDEIRSTKPDVVCVALGIPRQEKWIARHKNKLGASVYIGVGGTFDVLSGRVGRAPHWVQRLNLEWLYRLLKNPRKIGKVLTLPRFIIMTLRNERK